MTPTEATMAAALLKLIPLAKGTARRETHFEMKSIPIETRYDRAISGYDAMINDARRTLSDPEVEACIKELTNDR